MVGILCEKPSAARNFAKALGGQSGTFNGEQYVIAAARGHLFEFKDPKDMVPTDKSKQYQSWDLKYLPWDEADFDWQKVKSKGVADTLSAIKKVLSGVDEITIATDLDPSGEGFLLGWEVIEGLGLNTKNRHISRMYFTDESEKEIQKAFKTRKDVPDYRQNDEFMKADYRSKWDLLSMQWTRIATNCVNGKAILRQGRLKSVMVKIVGDQLKLVKEYVKKPFYYPAFKDDHGVVYREKNYMDNKQDSKEAVSLAQLHASTVDVDSRTKKSQIPPKLIDLATLSSRLAPRGFKAKTVLDTYQKMYEAKVVSYPRTEDKEITEEQFKDLAPLVDKIAGVVGVDPALLTHRQMRMNSHVKSGGAHGANRPGPSVPASLDDVESKYGKCGRAIYDILAKSYLAMLAPDYEYEAQKGHIHDFPTYVGSASVPLFMGWKQVFDDDADVPDDQNTSGLGTNAEPFVAEGVNPKPAAPTMKWLMKQLEKYDVGTGATRTSTYSDVTNEKTKNPLLIDKKGKILMSPFGDMSYILLENTIIGDPKMTEQVFAEMKQISLGKFKASVGLHQIQEYIQRDKVTMIGNIPKLQKEVKMVSENMKEKYKGTYVDGKEIQFSREWGGHRFTDAECEALLRGEKIVVSGLIAKKTGNEYAVEGCLEEQTYKGYKYWGFKNLGFAEMIPHSCFGHTFTDDEYAQLQAGCRIHIDDFVSKQKKKFAAWCYYGDTVDYKTKKPTGRKGIVLDFGK